jgi:hypothetical protein
MSVNFRNFGQAKQVLPKYLSDSLTPWWGNWAVQRPADGSTFSIAFDNLPVGDAIARVFGTQMANGGPGIVFNTPQNLNNMFIDMRFKASVAGATNMYIQLNNDIIPLPAGYNAVYCYAQAGAVPTVWTRYTLNVSEIQTKTGFGTISPVEISALLTRVKSVMLYASIAGPPIDINISAFTIRRP